MLLAEMGFWLMLLCLTGAATAWVVLRVLNEYRRWQGGTAAPVSTPVPRRHQPLAIVPGTGCAMRHPPKEMAATLQALRRWPVGERYRFPLGWCVCQDGSAGFDCAAFVGDTNHILLTAQSDGGKDAWASWVLLSLALQHPPAELQICLIDGKGLDFALWRDHPACWGLALEAREIAPLLKALTNERERRRQILAAAEVSKWDHYRGCDLPLLVVYVSELSLLQDAVGARELEQWLNTELAAGRAFGLRYIIATQTASNCSTRWRSQISLYVAGYQPSATQDEPNTGRTAKELRALGAVPPSELPGPPEGAGVFTTVANRSAGTARATYLTDADRRAILHELRARTSSQGGHLAGSAGAGAPAAVPVPADTDTVEPDQHQIRRWAAEGLSRNQIAARLGGNRAATLARIRMTLGDVPMGGCDGS